MSKIEDEPYPHNNRTHVLDTRRVQGSRNDSQVYAKKISLYTPTNTRHSQGAITLIGICLKIKIEMMNHTYKSNQPCPRFQDSLLRILRTRFPFTKRRCRCFL
jgi:hypothetical protein